MRQTAANDGRYFYFGMAWLLLAIVTYGFAQTAGDALFHPLHAPPLIIYYHAALFSLWVVLFVVQTGLVTFRHSRLHRALGQLSVVIGSVMPVLGLATAYVVQRDASDHAFFAVALNLPLLIYSDARRCVFESALRRRMSS